ncbi:hypothetical protein RND81_05G015700 [Saponaria officinalis]|uniref:Uncharacterized protein n=1 Tax=Saponaria officinalis TaxID=3572 RepID=A0AAW1KRX3_SAPOF
MRKWSRSMKTQGKSICLVPSNPAPINSIKKLEISPIQFQINKTKKIVELQNELNSLKQAAYMLPVNVTIIPVTKSQEQVRKYY